MYGLPWQRRVRKNRVRQFVRGMGILEEKIEPKDLVHPEYKASEHERLLLFALGWYLLQYDAGDAAYKRVFAEFARAMPHVTLFTGEQISKKLRYDFGLIDAHEVFGGEHILAASFCGPRKPMTELQFMLHFYNIAFGLKRKEFHPVNSNGSVAVQTDDSSDSDVSYNPLEHAEGQ
jgi:hypothetical protein